MYEGQWEAGRPHGEGSYALASGDVLRGVAARLDALAGLISDLQVEVRTQRAEITDLRSRLERGGEVHREGRVLL